MQFLSLCKTAVTKHKMLTYKLQNSSKTTCSERGQAKFDLSRCIGLVYVVTWLYAIMFLHLCREGCLYVSGQSFLLLLLLPSNLSAFQPVSASFCRCAEIMFLGVSGKTGCHVKRSCPASSLPQGVQQELLG